MFKAGLALDISPDPYFNEELRLYHQFTVRQWEQQFWAHPLSQYQNPRVYKAPIDTTFAVYNKAFAHHGFFDAVRVAVHFTCKHLPWYTNHSIPEEEKRQFNTEWSNWTQ